MERSIQASTAVQAPVEQARRLLVDDPGSVLTESVDDEDRRAGRFTAVLALDAVGAGATVRHEVTIELGEPVVGDAVVLPMSWRAVTLERLFPTFEGELVLVADGGAARLELRGSYDVPLGPVGSFGDGVLGRRIARRSLVVFLEGIARRLDAAATHARPTPSYPVALQEG